MTLYTDIYVRDDFSDSGDVPFRGDYYWGSPDIIPARRSVVSPDRLKSTYYSNQDIGENVDASQANNIFVRARNLGGPPASGTMTLCWAASSLFLYPDTWWTQTISTAHQRPSVDLGTLQQNEIGVGDSAFVFNAPSVPQGFHYCLIAVVQTPGHQVMKPSLHTNADFVNWIRNYPSVAFRNIAIVPAALPSYQQAAYFGNRNESAGDFIFLVQGTEWPDNTIVNIQCTAQGCQFNVTQPFGTPPQMVSTIQQVPGSFSSAVLVTITPPSGASVPPTATVSVKYGSIVTPDDGIGMLALARPLAAHGVTDSAAGLLVVILGQVGLECSEEATDA